MLQESGYPEAFSSGLFSPVSARHDPQSSYLFGRPPLPQHSAKDKDKERPQPAAPHTHIRSTSPNSMSIADALYQLRCGRSDDPAPALSGPTDDALTVS